jgi:hypothetical protein
MDWVLSFTRWPIEFTEYSWGLSIYNRILLNLYSYSIKGAFLEEDHSFCPLN